MNAASLLGLLFTPLFWKNRNFRVSPPSVHQMVLTLERAGLIARQPRAPRSIEVLVDPQSLPELI
jgi:hypothetical protein